jgi:sortase (surface protein transpeptidase)
VGIYGRPVWRDRDRDRGLDLTQPPARDDHDGARPAARDDHDGARPPTHEDHDGDPPAERRGRGRHRRTADRTGHRREVGPAPQPSTPFRRQPEIVPRGSPVYRRAPKPVARVSKRPRRLPRRQRIRLLAVLLGLLGLFGTGLGLGQGTDLLPTLSSFGFGRESAPSSRYPALKPSRPVGITIPAIDVRAPVHPVGLAADGSIAVPEVNVRNEAGWFDRGPTPGQYGPAVIVGHVDGSQGPAVFARLHSLRAGSQIEVTRRDQRVTVFRVDSVARYDKSHLPADRIYNDFSRPGLRLITCGGRWVGGERGYADNVVVFASLVSARRA